jgi:hypothetical protein
MHQVSRLLRSGTEKPGTQTAHARRLEVERRTVQPHRRKGQAGALPYLLGTPLALGSYWGFLPLAAMTPFLIWRLIDEERFLSKNLPGYTEYCTQVRWRLIPGVF